MKNTLKYLVTGLILLAGFTGVNAQNTFNIRNNTYRIGGLNGDFKVNYKGQIKVADDDKSIKSISPGGYLEIEKKTFGNSRKLNIYPKSDGSLVYEYKEGSGNISFEPNGRKWMEEILPDVIRNAGIDIEGRVNRIYSKSRINGILAEIASIESDFISSKYYSVLITQQKLSDSEYKLAIIALSKTISSDFEKSNVLRQVNRIYSQNDGLTEAYLTTVSLMSSDFEKSNVLKNFDVSNFSENQLKYFLNTTNTMNSDFERSNVIKYLLNRKSIDPAIFSLLVKVTSGMNSDFEKSNCFGIMLSKQNHDKVLIEIFNAIEQMNSDFEKGNLLKKGAGDIKPASVEAFFDAVNSMNSDFERSAVLQAVIRTNNPDDALFTRIFNSTSGISSDFEKGNILRIASSKIKPGSQAMDAYFGAINSMNSDFERSSVLKSTIVADNCDEAMYIRIFNSTATMSSDFEKSSVLTLAAGRMPKTDKVKEAYVKTANTINGTYEYGNVMKPIR